MKDERPEKISVTGAGLMGHGIALQFAAAGFEVALHDTSGEQLEKALEDIRSALDTLRQQGVVDEAAAASAPGRIRTTTSLPEAAAEAALVVEAVYEDLPLKQRVFADLDRHCPPRAVLASNTSSFMTSQLAPSTRRPDRVGGRQLVESRLPGAPRRGGARAGDERRYHRHSSPSSGGSRQAADRAAEGVAGIHRQPHAVRAAARGPRHRRQGDRHTRGRRRGRQDQLRPKALGRRPPRGLRLRRRGSHLPTSSTSCFPTSTRVRRISRCSGRWLPAASSGFKSGKGFYEWDEERIAALKRRLAHALSSIDRFPE